MFDFKFLFIVFLMVYVISAYPCPFNDQCTCEYDILEKTLRANCNNFAIFPELTTYDLTGIYLYLNITGTLVSIPYQCVYNLSTADGISLYITGQFDYPYQQLIVDPEGFQVAEGKNISALVVNNYYLPLGRHTDLSYVQYLWFNDCNIPTVNANAFSGFKGWRYGITNCSVETVDPNAFDDLGPFIFFISTNLLTDISVAFKSLQTDSLDLSANQITNVPDFAFCSCNVSSACSNVIQYLDLLHNPIAIVADNAFANLPNLLYLGISFSQLTSIPVTAISQLPTLTELDLSYNQITSVQANSFYNLHSVTNLYLANNPINTIEPGAFNGMTSVTNFGIGSLYQLTDIDLLVAYGMTSLEKLVFSNCPNLNTIYLSDYTKLPASLILITMQNMNISHIDSEVQYWLGLSSFKYIDLSYNLFFTCDSSVRWMSEFACCKPIQIITDGARCAGTNQLLKEYLQSFKPICI